MNDSRRQISIAAIASVTSFALIVLAAAQAARAEVNWPSWGGPAGSYHTSETGLPLEWTSENVVWKTDLPGAGQSTPVIWGDRIFLTTALDKGRERVVMCVDRRDGKVLWQQTAWTGQAEDSHVMNGWASATCATNGKVVVAFFGRGGLHGFSLDGERLWSRDLGEFKGPWGTAASPVFHGDTVIQNCDSESPEAALVAVDYRTGETVWSTPREVMRGWSTPILIRAGEREELVLNGHSAVRGYDPKSGRELWSCASFNGRGEPVPAYAHGLLYVVNGLAGDIYAVKPGGEGDVTATNRVWHTPRKGGARPAVAGRDRRLPAGDEHGRRAVLLRLPERPGTVEGAGGREVFLDAAGGRRPGLLSERGRRDDRDRAGRDDEDRRQEQARLARRRTVPLGDRPVRRPVVHPLDEAFVLHRPGEVAAARGGKRRWRRPTRPRAGGLASVAPGVRSCRERAISPHTIPR